jgi:signal peptidase I
MAPLLEIGDKVLVQKVTTENIRRGDIIMYKKLNKLLTHRVIDILNNDGSAFLQKGDNDLAAEKVNKAEFLGKVTAVKKDDRIIHFDKKKFKVINRILTSFSAIIYIVNRKNSSLKWFALYPLNRMKKLFNQFIKKIYL